MVGAFWIRSPVVTAIIALSVGSAAGGPIKTDDSLGRTAKDVAPVRTPDDRLDYRIRPGLGERHGGNLFHSFQRFGIPADTTATFVGPDAIHNVMARVTGSDRSEILGTLRSKLRNADVWLINPNGVVFGKDARIDVPGALHVSTADDIRLAHGEVFSASDPGPIMTSAAPEAFGFLGASAQPTIRFETFVLPGDQAITAQRLNLIGGDVRVENADLLWEGERGPDIGIVATAGAVVIRVADVAADRKPTFDPAQGGAVTIDRSSLVPRGDVQGGAIALLGRDIRISDSTLDTGGGVGGPILIVGDSIDLRAAEPTPGTLVGARIDEAGVRAGPIRIEGGTIRIGQGALVQSATDGPEPAKPVVLSGSSIVIDGGVVRSSADEGQAAPITLSAAQVRIDRGRVVSEFGVGQGEGAAPGRIRVGAERRLTVRGDPEQEDPDSDFIVGIDTSTASAAGGNIIIDASNARLTISHGGVIQTVSEGTAEAGDLSIDAQRLAILRGGEIKSVANATAKAGDLTIDARNLVISREGSDQFTGIASSAGEHSGKGGDAGAIVVRADSIEIGDLGAIASDSSGGGDAGSVTVGARRIELRDGGQISSLTLPVEGAGDDSTGRGGSVRVTARQSITIAGEGPRPQRVRVLEIDDDGRLRRVRRLINPPSSITASTESPQGRRAGDVEVKAPVIRIADRGEISSESFNRGPGGRVTVRAFDRLEIDDGEITTKANFADAGNIQITSGRLLELWDNGEISTTVSKEEGRAGNIDVTAPSVALNQSRIQANGDLNRGGDITIRSDALIQTPDSVIEALSNESIDGEVDVPRPDDPTSGVVALEASLEQRSELVTDPCAIRDDRPISALIVREVYPDLPDPEQPLPGPRDRTSTEPGGPC